MKAARGTPTRLPQQSLASDNEDATAGIWLAPVRSLRRRSIVVAALCALALVGTTGWRMKAAFCISMALWIGSFRQARVLDGCFCRELFLAFVRVQSKRWKLERFVGIETSLEDSPFDSLAQISQVGELFNKAWRFIDSCVPWFGGEYKLWLRAASGKRVLAWQGSRDEDFQANLQLLIRVTRLPVERR
ncbi:MAG TPA: hypothetical protein VFW87_22785 [Pirellulales bacterium]|nr:hypothetical protein [Pirellulales bacterium]